VNATASPPAADQRGRADRELLDPSGYSGLSEAEVQQRLAAEGPNELPSSKPRGLPAIALEVIRQPMFLLLMAASGLYFGMGELGTR